MSVQPPVDTTEIDYSVFNPSNFVTESLSSHTASTVFTATHGVKYGDGTLQTTAGSGAVIETLDVGEKYGSEITGCQFFLDPFDSVKVPVAPGTITSSGQVANYTGTYVHDATVEVDTSGVRHFEFDGAGDHVDFATSSALIDAIPDATATSGSFTMWAWMNSDSTTDVDPILSTATRTVDPQLSTYVGAGVEISMRIPFGQTDREYTVRVGTPNLPNKGFYNVNTGTATSQGWHMFALTGEPNGAISNPYDYKAYLDGVLIHTFQNEYNTPVSGVRVGLFNAEGNINANSDATNAKIGHCGITNTAFTQEQITNIYNETKVFYDGTHKYLDNELYGDLHIHGTLSATTIVGGGSSSVSVTANGGLEIDGNGDLKIKDVGVTNAMLAGSIADDKLASTFLKSDVAVAFTAAVTAGNNGSIEATKLSSSAVKTNGGIQLDGNGALELDFANNHPFNIKTNGTTAENGLQIATGFAGDGLDIASQVMSIDLASNGGLAFSNGQLTIDGHGVTSNMLATSGIKGVNASGDQDTTGNAATATTAVTATTATTANGLSSSALATDGGLVLASGLKLDSTISINYNSNIPLITGREDPNDGQIDDNAAGNTGNDNPDIGDGTGRTLADTDLAYNHTAPLSVFFEKDNVNSPSESTDNNIIEILKLHRHCSDDFKHTNVTVDGQDAGGYIGLYVTDDNNGGEMARISWRADNAENREGDGRLGFWTAECDGDYAENMNIYERMSITHDGYVGIGTTSPSQLLEVNGNVKANTIQLQTTTTGTTSLSGTALTLASGDVTYGTYDYEYSGNSAISINTFTVSSVIANGQYVVRIFNTGTSEVTINPTSSATLKSSLSSSIVLGNGEHALVTLFYFDSIYYVSGTAFL